jgi:hypothetical protein
MAERVYHLELRRFPHNTCRFNVPAQELRSTVLEPWSREQWIEVGERKWNPHQATLTVIEGPPIPAGQLTMGRGWRTAQRQGRVVTEELLQAARGTSPEAVESDLTADSLGLELLSRTGFEGAPLAAVWKLAGERHPGAPASATLALAERAVAALLRGRLVVLLDHSGSEPRTLTAEESERALTAIASWVEAAPPGAIRMRRV